MKSLQQIGLETGTDKAAGREHGHGYLDFYETFLQQYRNDPVLLLEIGIGGEQYEDRGGESLQMWDRYFLHPDASILGLDLYAKNLKTIKHFSDRVHTYAGSQDDPTILEKEDTLFDIIIDDASHVNPVSIETFNLYFPLLKPGGVYIWEDLHTSFWPKQYQGAFEPMTPGTALHYLSELVHGLQADSILEKHRHKWAGHIQSMHFMRNTCVLIKRK